MLYKFKSKATADLIMLAPHAHQVLSAIGKAPSASGIVLPTEMPTAIAALQAALAQEAQKTKEAHATASQAESDSTNTKSVGAEQASDAPSEHTAADGAPESSITLAQRAAPFLAMLGRAQAANVAVVWGV